MANGLGLFQTRPIQRSSIDPVKLAEILAGPEVARQKAKADIFSSIAQLPQNIIEKIQKQKELNLKTRKITAEDSIGRAFPDTVGMSAEEAMQLIKSGRLQQAGTVIGTLPITQEKAREIATKGERIQGKFRIVPNQGSSKTSTANEFLKKFKF